MSTVKTNRVQLGQSATATQNFTLTAEAADGSMKLARGVAGGTTQDILTINSLGEVDFPQMIRSFGANGYQKLPGGLIIQWGSSTSGATGTVTFPLAFPNSCASVTGTCVNTVGSVETLETVTITNTNFSFAIGNGTSFRWIAIGY